MTIQSIFPMVIDKWSFQDHFLSITLPTPIARVLRFFHFIVAFPFDNGQFIHVIVLTVFKIKSLIQCDSTHT